MKEELINVLVYPDGYNTTVAAEWMSDDYRVRRTTICETCREPLWLEYDEPIASCNCGSQEWYM